MLYPRKTNQNICYNCVIITDRKVGFEFKDRNLVFLNQPMTPYIPFSVKVRLPKPDHGKRGFSDAYINKVRKRLYGKEADLVSGGISRRLS